jgi:hypothetical protein
MGYLSVPHHLPHPVLHLIAILSSGTIYIIWSLIASQNYDFKDMASAIALIDDKLPEYDDEAEQKELLTGHAKRWITMSAGLPLHRHHDHPLAVVVHPCRRVHRGVLRNVGGHLDNLGCGGHLGVNFAAHL